MRTTAMLVLIALAPPALAERGEHVLSLRGEYTRTAAHGGGAALAYAYGFDDFWNITADAGWAMDQDGAGLVHASAGVLYHLDAFQFVPYLFLTTGWAGGLPVDGNADHAASIGAGGGIDWRPARRWGAGVFGAYNTLLGGTAAGYVEAGLRLNLYLY